ncbi:MAG TPA: GAF domain-containing protein, partial [Candidatus Omnitrophota bacterium]|nr:GAF domain-containing protein [Candidatus Omnitrophota bacterium]
MYSKLEEARRIDILRRYAILDTPPEPTFDRIAWLAATHFGTPIGTVTFIDETRQWFKAIHGATLRETCRSIAFCSHAIEQDAVMVVPDASADSRFADNPLVTADPHIRFYAGAPLCTQDGLKLGTVSVIDSVPHADLSPDQKRFLTELARLVVEELELRLAAGDVAAEIERRRRIEAELQRSNDCFRLAMQHSPFCLFTQDTGYRYTWAINTPPPYTPDKLIGR